jgi:hypothetical protein
MSDSVPLGLAVTAQLDAHLLREGTAYMAR